MYAACCEAGCRLLYRYLLCSRERGSEVVFACRAPCLWFGWTLWTWPGLSWPLPLVVTTRYASSVNCHIQCEKRTIKNAAIISSKWISNHLSRACYFRVFTIEGFVLKVALTVHMILGYWLTARETQEEDEAVSLFTDEENPAKFTACKFVV